MRPSAYKNTHLRCSQKFQKPMRIVAMLSNIIYIQPIVIVFLKVSATNDFL